MPREENEDFKEMELWEHLAELRQRLIRSLVWVFVGLIAAWILYRPLYELLMHPLRELMEKRGWEFVIRNITHGFTLQLSISLIAGLIVAIPLVTLEAWGFIAPGLTRNEKKVCRIVFPLSVFFFLMGVVCGYLVLEPAVWWFADFVPKDMVVQQDPVMWLTFMVKMIVAFGICFQLPIILMLLCFLGLVSSTLLKEQWRLCLVACFVVAAVATPGGDPISMFVMALPLGILYVSSIGLCQMVERFKDVQEKKASLTFSTASD